MEHSAQSTNAGTQQAPLSPLVFDEYKFIAESVRNATDRRQRTNEIYIAINTLFLSGIGLILVSSHFDSWRPAIEVGVISAIITPLNLAWHWAIGWYQRVIAIHMQSLSELESRYHFEVNISTRLGLGYAQIGRGKAIASYFFALYLALTSCVILLTYFAILGQL